MNLLNDLISIRTIPLLIACTLLLAVGIPAISHAQVATPVPGTIITLGDGFNSPKGVAVDSQGNVYVADTGNNAVKMISVDGTITTLGSGFNFPFGVAVDSLGTVYVSDTWNNAVKRINGDGTTTTLGSVASMGGVAVDSQDNIYVADTFNSAVKMISADGTTTTLGSGFSWPEGVAVDSQGTVYVADTYNCLIKKINANGTTTILGNGFSYPRGVAVDSRGTVYVADTNNNAVKRINADGTTTTLGSGFDYPWDVAVDSLGDVFVADTNNSAVKEIITPMPTPTPTPSPTDVTPPVTTCSLAGVMGCNDWYTSVVQVTLSATDGDGSGVAKTEYSLDNGMWTTYDGAFNIPDGVHTLAYCSVDNAGNVEAAQHQAIKVDTAPPVIMLFTPVMNAEYRVGQKVMSNFTVWDGMSGIAWCSPSYNVPLNTSCPGMKFFGITAMDNAGNLATIRLTFNVLPSSNILLQPLDGKVYNGNQALPVKFQLTDSNGNYITNAVASLYVAKINNGVVGTERKAIAKGNSNTDNLFKYTDGYYQYNLDLKTLGSGSWQLRIVLSDGSSKTAVIQIK